MTREKDKKRFELLVIYEGKTPEEYFIFEGKTEQDAINQVSAWTNPHDVPLEIKATRVLYRRKWYSIKEAQANGILKKCETAS